MSSYLPIITAAHGRILRRAVLPQPIALLLSCVTILLIAGCGENSLTLDVSLSGIDDDISFFSVQLSASVPLPERTVPRAPHFIAQLPASLSAQAQVSLTINGMRADGCPVAVGSTQVTLTGATGQPVSIALSRLEKQGCRLVVERSGDGKGSIAASVPGQSCTDGCEISLSPGTKITLRASEGENSYFAGWSGACTGVDACAVTIGAKPATVRATFLPTRLCSETGFCWENPLPQGNGLLRVSGSAEDDVWAVGASGTILHFDGSFWVPYKSGTFKTLNGLFVESRTSAWTVGNGGTILRWNGEKWQAVPSNTTQDLYAVWGSGHGDLRTVGDGGTVLRWDGAAWRPENTGARQNLRAIWGHRADDIWVGGFYSELKRWNGATWSSPVRLEPGTNIWDIWGPPDAPDVWLVGPNYPDWSTAILHWNGTEFVPSTGETLSDPPSPASIWGPSKDDVWALDYFGGRVFRFDGQLWRVGATPAETGGLSAIWGTSRNNAWAVGVGGIPRHWNGAYWSSSSALQHSITSLWGQGQDLWAVGTYGTILHRTKLGWLPAGEPQTAQTLSGVSGSSPKDIWMVGAGGILVHWDGKWLSSWQSIVAKDLYAVWALESDRFADLWITGDNGTVLTETDAYGTLTVVPSGTTKRLLSVWGTVSEEGQEAVWIVGEGGTILKSDGTATLKPVASGTTVTLSNVWGSGLDDVWIGGSGGVLLHWDGAALGRVPLASAGIITGLSGTGPNDVWVAIADPTKVGLLLHFDGMTWSTMEVGIGNGFSDILSRSPGDLYIAGGGGMIIHRAGPP